MQVPGAGRSGVAAGVTVEELAGGGPWMPQFVCPLPLTDS